MNDLAPFLEAAVRTATPLLIAAMGEAIAERAGAINLGLEGCIIIGAYVGFALGATSTGGYAAAMLAGAGVGLVFAAFAVFLRRDQIIVGTALTMLGLGLTGTMFRARDAGLKALVDTDPVLRIPVLSEIPVIGSALFAQPMVTYVAVALVPLAWWVLHRTQVGLALRAVGEAPEAARAAGVRAKTIQASAVIVGSAFGGLAGAALVLAQAGAFAEGMSAGRGFLAIAIVALGRWRPIGVALAALVFGAAMALQFVVQAFGWTVRYELVLMIPYLLTHVARVTFGKGSAPAMQGRPLDER
ncbi:MAG: ABC transporter permease [Gemmatimonadaceae bacterium]